MAFKGYQTPRVNCFLVNFKGYLTQRVKRIFEWLLRATELGEQTGFLWLLNVPQRVKRVSYGF